MSYRRNARKNIGEAPSVCYKCGKPALAGVTTSEGPACYKHALNVVGVPVGEEDEERSCRKCGSMINDASNTAYVEGAGLYHPKCLEESVISIGRCPKCSLPLSSFDSDCMSCYGGIHSWIDQARKDAQSVFRSSGEKLCSICLIHNSLIGPGYPFYAVDPNVSSGTCLRCFKSICSEHSAQLPEGNVLNISTDDIMCGNLPFRGKGRTCLGELESSIECSIDGCDAFGYGSKDDPFLTSQKCNECDRWFCGVLHDPTECPDCVGVRCDDCNKIFDKDDLFSIQEGMIVSDLCGDCISDRESEERNSAWGDWLGLDYKKALRNRFSAEDIDMDPDDVDQDLEELFEKVREESGIEWEGSSIDSYAVAQCTPVERLLNIGVRINDVPVTKDSAFPRKVLNALNRVESMTTKSGWEADRIKRAGRGDKAPQYSDTRRSRAAMRADIRKTMSRGGGLWASPEQRLAIKSLPKTVEGMRRMMVEVSDLGKPRKSLFPSKYVPAVQMPTPEEVTNRSRYLSAIRRERNPGS